MSVALMVVVVAKRRVFQLLSGIGSAGVEQTAQKIEKHGWMQTEVRRHDGAAKRTSCQQQLLGFSFCCSKSSGSLKPSR